MDKVVDVGDVMGLGDFIPVLDALVALGAFREEVEQGAMAEAELGEANNADDVLENAPADVVAGTSGSAAISSSVSAIRST